MCPLEGSSHYHNYHHDRCNTRCDKQNCAYRRQQIIPKGPKLFHAPIYKRPSLMSTKEGSVERKEENYGVHMCTFIAASVTLGKPVSNVGAEKRSRISKAFTLKSGFSAIFCA